MLRIAAGGKKQVTRLSQQSRLDSHRAPFNVGFIYVRIGGRPDPTDRTGPTDILTRPQTLLQSANLVRITNPANGQFSEWSAPPWLRFAVLEPLAQYRKHRAALRRYEADLLLLRPGSRRQTRSYSTALRTDSTMQTR
jgi:hypothetical protein